MRVQWRDAGAHYATNLDNHLFGVKPGGVLAVEPYDVALLVRRRVGARGQGLMRAAVNSVKNEGPPVTNADAVEGTRQSWIGNS